MANNKKAVYQTSKASSKADKMAVSAKNLRLMIAGLVVILSGFLLLSGGGSSNPEVFNYAMFSARRLVAAPIVIVAGIVVEVIAIMGRFDKKKED